MEPVAASSEEVVYLNGQFLRKGEATISITDFGFNFGAGIYEVTQVCSGKLYQLKEHLDRFIRSCQMINLPLKQSYQELVELNEAVVEKNHLNDGIVYMQATFGAYGARSHFIPAETKPTLLILTQPLKTYPPKYYDEGIALTLVPDKRHQLCQAKTIGLLPNIIAINQASKEGFQEVVFFNKDDLITECSSANVFCVKDGTLWTAPLTSNILPGITRDQLLKLAKQDGIPVKEENFTKQFLLEADEVFISSTTRHLWPVKQVDDRKYTSPGPLTKKLLQLILNYIQDTLQVKLTQFQ